jgi:hypothetical protein
MRSCAQQNKGLHKTKYMLVWEVDNHARMSVESLPKGNDRWLGQGRRHAVALQPAPAPAAPHHLSAWVGAYSELTTTQHNKQVKHAQTPHVEESANKTGKCAL